jgi:bifunctional non-homologous end joining protein LigD
VPTHRQFPDHRLCREVGRQAPAGGVLLFGATRRGKLLYGGKIESGYTWDEAQEIREALDLFVRKDSPLDEAIDKPKATWVEPVVEAEIDYRYKTDAGLIRHGSFKGLRDDLATVDIPKPATPAVRRRVEQAKSAGGNPLPPLDLLELLGANEKRAAAYTDRPAFA